MSTNRLNNRIQAFAKAHNARPEDVKPGHEFIAWINRHWTEYCATQKTAPGRNHAEFDAWLNKKYGGAPC